ncbi:mammalian ependymin-related protein 1 [Alligator sinensis]|uniref:Mammalian ependymin-related protein 1 n=1 Tax=Alligator sinensis TaxID=38654 RepID=A0A3Q0H5W4_ALLSI|nr:mammalian ependymin-related protein 1 [Alligator sinensis]
MTYISEKAKDFREQADDILLYYYSQRVPIFHSPAFQCSHFLLFLLAASVPTEKNLVSQFLVGESLWLQAARRNCRFFEYIFLYKDAVLFQIEQVTKLCSKIALTEPWDPYDIPANSTYEDQYYIGGPGDEIMVQEWSDRKPARKLESWVGVYTIKDCYPVQETYTRNYSVTTSTRFFDLQLGISDPSVFTPPSTCQEALPRRMKDEC